MFTANRSLRYSPEIPVRDTSSELGGISAIYLMASYLRYTIINCLTRRGIGPGCVPDRNASSKKLDVIEIIGREEALPSCMMTLLKGIAPAPLGGPGWSNGLNRRLSWVTSQ